MKTPTVGALLSAVLFCGSIAAYAAVPSTASGLVDIDIKNVPVKQAIETIFDGKGLKYIIEPGVTGRVVELRLKGVSVAEALKSLGDAAGFCCRIEDGIYMIGPTKAAAAVQAPIAAPVPMSSAPPQISQGPMPPAHVAAPPITVNNYIPPDNGGGSYASAPPPPAYGGYGGGYGYGYPYVIQPPPWILGVWPNPPPPPGWVSSDQERLLRFQWAVTRRPSFIQPPYWY